MELDKYLIVDFDSTFLRLEGLEELAKIALRNEPDKDKLLKQIEEITNLGMTGELSFRESLVQRLELFKPKKEHITELINVLAKNVTKSIIDNENFFSKFSSQIYVLSGGFNEWIIPVVGNYGISKEHVIANNFLVDSNDILVPDLSNPLTNSGGKALSIRNLGIKGTIIMIGDGYTDYEVKKLGAADKFIMFSENINRPSVESLADEVAHDWGEIIELFAPK